MNIVNKGIIIVLQKMNYFIGIIEVSLLKRVMVDLMDLRSSDRHRIPKKIAKSISKTAVVNNEFLAGEKIEFIVKDRTIEICALFNKRCVLNHMSDTATSGIDIYTRHIDKYVWVKTIAPKNCFQMLVNEKIEFEYDVNEVMIYLPSYASLNKLLINNRIHMKPFKTEEKKKIAFYGSSITQGCAASRPGLSYPNILSRLIDCHVSNYGFSESANGEKIVMEYIGKTNCDVVILEYDHNSSIEVLRKAHIVAYKSLRRYTSCRIIFMSRLSGGVSITIQEELERIEIIKSTYDYAKSMGDHNVSFLDGRDRLGYSSDDILVDGVHPNDVGMQVIAQKLYMELCDGD